jgi:hypothetical protein
MIWFPRHANPADSQLPTCYINMTEEEAQERLDRANAWLARNSGLEGTHDYTYRVFEKFFAEKRLGQIRGTVALA